MRSLTMASGEDGRFQQMFAEYEQDLQKDTTDVTLTRLHLESMEKVLG